MIKKNKTNLKIANTYEENSLETGCQLVRNHRFPSLEM